MTKRKGTYIAYDATGVTDSVASNLSTFEHLTEWQKAAPERFPFNNMRSIHFSAHHDDLLVSTAKYHMAEQMAQAENMLIVASPVLNTESDILNWQISRGVNRFHLPVIIAYWGLEQMTEETIQKYWVWLPQKVRKYITYNSWACMAHIPLTKDKLERAIHTYSSERQVYPWDALTIF